MTTKATNTKGIKLQRGDGGGPETFTLIGEITNIKGPSEKASPIDATSFDSVAMEFIGGLPDNGELTFDCNFIGGDTQQQGLRTDLRNGTKRNFKLILNDNVSTPTTVTFAAVVTAAPEISGSVNAIVKGSCSVRISGQPTWTYAP